MEREEIEKLAKEKYPEKWIKSFRDDETHKDWDINKQYRRIWIEGFLACQELSHPPTDKCEGNAEPSWRVL